MDLGLRPGDLRVPRKSIRYPPYALISAQTPPDSGGLLQRGVDHRLEVRQRLGADYLRPIHEKRRHRGHTLAPARCNFGLDLLEVLAAVQALIELIGVQAQLRGKLFLISYRGPSAVLAALVKV